MAKRYRLTNYKTADTICRYQISKAIKADCRVLKVQYIRLRAQHVKLSHRQIYLEQS